MSLNLKKNYLFEYLYRDNLKINIISFHKLQNKKNNHYGNVILADAEIYHYIF